MMYSVNGILVTFIAETIAMTMALHIISSGRLFVRVSVVVGSIAAAVMVMLVTAPGLPVSMATVAKKKGQ